MSRSSGQVAHVLLTRSPLALHQYCYRMERVRLACVRHAASVRPEPGSNSPSRLRPAKPQTGSSTDQESESHHSLTRTIVTTDPFAPKGSEAYVLLIDVQPIRLSPDELPALAFGSHYSVFKERPGTHQSSRCWCRVCQRTAPDDAGESPSAAGGPWGAVPTGVSLYQARDRASTRFLRPRTSGGYPGCGLCHRS